MLLKGRKGRGTTWGRSGLRQHLYTLHPSSRLCMQAFSPIRLPSLWCRGTPKYCFYYKKGLYRLLRIRSHSCFLPSSSVRVGIPSESIQCAGGKRNPQIESLVETVKKEKEHVKLHYMRHGREFLVGVAGSRLAVEKIKARIAQFLRTDLHLEVGLTSHVHIQSGSVVFLGTRIAGLFHDNRNRRFSKEIEKRRRSKVRVQRMAQVRTETWHNELKDLSLQAWAFGLKKTKKELQSWEAAKQAMFKKAKEVSHKFVLEQIERGETLASLQRILDKEEEVFIDAASTGVPEEIIRAHRRLTRLLQRHVEEETMFEKKAKALERSQQQVRIEKPQVQEGIALQLLAPMEIIVEKLRIKGVLQPTKALPTVLTSMLSSSDEAIVSYFAALGNCLLSYYRCCDNFTKVRRLVDHQVRWSALFTLGSKHGCSARKIIRSFSRGPQLLNRKGEVMVEYPSSPDIARMGKKFIPNIQLDTFDDILRSRGIQLLPSEVPKGPRRVRLRD